MTEKELKELLNDKSIIENAMAMMEDEAYFEIEKPKDNKLESYLQIAEDKIIKTIYTGYSFIDKEKKHYKKEVDINEMRIVLLKRIPVLFKEYLETSITNEEVQIFNDNIENNKTTIRNINLLGLGFVYELKEKDNKIYVVVEDLKEIYKNNFKEENLKEIMYQKIDMYSSVYITVNGIIPKDFLEDLIINNYKINITKEELKEHLSNKFGVYEDYYTMFIDEESKFNEIIKPLKENKPYKIFEEEELLSYKMYISHIIDEICKIIKDNTDDTKAKLFIAIALSGITTEDIVKKINSSYILNDKQLDKLTKLIDREINDFISYATNGYSIYEFIRNEIVDFYNLSSYPKNKSFNEIIKLLPKDALEKLCNLYNCEKESLLEKVKISFKSYLEILDSEEIYFLEEDYNSNNIESINYENIENGYIFVYKEDDETKIILPTELEEILSEYNSNFNSYDLIKLVLEYLKINGVIEIQILLNLLNNNHNLGLSYNDLVTILKELGANIIGKYCTIISELDKNIIKEYIEIKKDISYKIVDLDNLDKFDDLYNEISKYLDKTNYSKDNKQQILENALTGTRHGVFSKERYDEILRKINITLSKKELLDIDNIVKKYKNHIGVWTYNGYTLFEYNRLSSVRNNSNKVGRNDMCPCGSGKKYKKCCGR